MVYVYINSFCAFFRSLALQLLPCPRARAASKYVCCVQSSPGRVSNFGPKVCDGVDGVDGVDVVDGVNGVDGVDGVTVELLKRGTIGVCEHFTSLTVIVLAQRRIEMCWSGCTNECLRSNPELC